MRLFIQIRVCSVIEKWTKNFNHDIVDKKDGEEIKQKLLNFVEGILAEDQWKLAKTIRKSIYRMVNIKMIIFIYNFYIIINPISNLISNSINNIYFL